MVASGLQMVVASHKPYWMPEDNAYIPVWVGAALRHDTFPEGWRRDDEGANISAKNQGYCELTALYWAWKNLDAEYLGLVHYRRHFAMSTHPDARRRVATSEFLQGVLDRCPVVLPIERNYFVETNWSQYAHAHHERDLYLVRKTIADRTPEYLKAFDRRMAMTHGHRFNMFVMRRDYLDAYCSWLFGTLFELEDRLDITGYSENDLRVYGFIAERLLDVWLDTNDLAYTSLPLVNLEPQHWPTKIVSFFSRKIRGGASGGALSCNAYDCAKANTGRVVAVIVTYNRRELLMECVEALMAQTIRNRLDILIVDNASDDGTEDMLLPLVTSGNVLYMNTGTNLGGAGGFQYGMRTAAEGSWTWAWVMDDDCVPAPDALERLLEADAALGSDCGFLSSRVLWKDGSICAMNVPRSTPFRPVIDFNSDLVPIKMASFVSLLVPTKVIRKVGLPIAEFFIWTDDWEFTRRISLEIPCYLVNRSVVVHKSASNRGADVSADVPERLGRFFYLYRNDVYLYRREGVRGFAYETVRLSAHIARVLLKAPSYRMLRLQKICAGTWAGLSFHPEVKFPNKGGDAL